MRAWGDKAGWGDLQTKVSQIHANPVSRKVFDERHKKQGARKMPC